MPTAQPSAAQKSTILLNVWRSGLYVVIALLMGLVAGCVAPPRVSEAASAAATPPPPVVVIPAPSPPAVPVPTPAPVSVPPPLAAPKEVPLVDLPSYAKRGKRLPADGGTAGRAVLSYCRSFEVDKDAATYFKRLQKQNRLPTETELTERNRQNDQTLSVQQFVERDWALRRDNNKSVPQKCKVLGGSTEGATAHVVFEADLNGRRQRGTASVALTNGKWNLRDHGDWSPVR